MPKNDWVGDRGNKDGPRQQTKSPDIKKRRQGDRGTLSRPHQLAYQGRRPGQHTSPPPPGEIFLRTRDDFKGEGKIGIDIGLMNDFSFLAFFFVCLFFFYSNPLMKYTNLCNR